MVPEAAQYVRGADTTGQLLAFELGNEPNGYLTSTGAYMERIGRYVAALDASPLTVGVPITGPAISENADVAYAAALWPTPRACPSRPGTTTPIHPTWAACWRR